MVYCLLTCRSLTYAQRSARLLERAGISARIIKTPHTLTDGSCGYSLKLPERNLTNALSILASADYSPVKAFIQLSGGKYREVAL